MRDLLKWGLLAGGTAFLFKDQLTAWFDAAAPQQPSTAPPTTAPPTTYYPPPTTAPPPYYPPVGTPSAVNPLPVTDELIKKASWDMATAQILSNRIFLNTHQWNWYYEHSGGGRTNPGHDFSAYGGGDPNTPITAIQYRAKWQQAGLGGLHNAQWQYKRILQ